LSFVAVVHGDWQRLVAHLVVVISAAVVVLVVIFVLLHLVGVLVAHFLPVDVLATGAAAAGDDVGFGDGFQVVVDFLVVCCGVSIVFGGDRGVVRVLGYRGGVEPWRVKPLGRDGTAPGENRQ
jgi:hypothetical protein